MNYSWIVIIDITRLYTKNPSFLWLKRQVSGVLYKVTNPLPSFMKKLLFTRPSLFPTEDSVGSLSSDRSVPILLPVFRLYSQVPLITFHIYLSIRLSVCVSIYLLAETQEIMEGSK